MNIPYELQEPFEYSWDLVKILVVIIVLLVLAYIFILLMPLFSNRLKKVFKKTQVPSLKVRYVSKLERLMSLVRENKISNRDAYTELSVIIREFVKKTTGINVLSLSKNEIEKVGMNELSLLMEEYYPPEFAKNDDGDIIKSIEKTIEVIKVWK